MAGKRDKYEAEIVATDKASTVIKGVDDKLQALTDKAEVELSAEDKASADILQLRARLSTLTAAEYEAVLTAEATKLKREVDNANKLLAKVDGETAEAVIDAKDQASARLDAVQAELNSIDGRTATATVDAKEGSGLAGILDDLDGLPGNLSKLASPGGAIALVGGAFAGAALKAADVAIEADQIANFTGASVEEASALSAVLRDNTQIEMGDLLDIVAQMSGVLAQTPELADQLGINIEEAQNPLDLFVMVVDALRNSQLSANERLLLGAQLFGEEGVRQVNELTSALDGDLSDAIAGVSGSRIISEEDVAQARKLKQQWTELSAVVQGIVLDVGGPLISAVNDAIAGLDWLLSGGQNINERRTELEKFTKLIEILGDENLDFAWLANLEDADFQRIAAEIGVTDEQLAEFIRLLGEGVEPADAWAQAVGGEVGALEDVADAAAEATGATEGTTEATGEATAALDEHVAALEAEKDALDETIEALENKLDAQLASVDAFYAQRQAERDVIEATEDYNAAEDDSTTAVDEKAEALDRAVLSYADLADANVRLAEEEAAARGQTLSHRDALNIRTSTMLNAARTMDGPMQDALLAYILRLHQIPEERITEILTDTDPNNLGQTEAEIAPLERTREVAFELDATEESKRRVQNDINSIAAQKPTIFYRFAAANSPPSGKQLRRATGDPFTTAGTFMVGEQGPELVELPTGARINSAPETAAMDRQPSVVNNSTTIINMPQGVRPTAVVDAERTYRRRQGNV